MNLYNQLLELVGEETITSLTTAQIHELTVMLNDAGLLDVSLTTIEDSSKDSDEYTEEDSDEGMTISECFKQSRKDALLERPKVDIQTITKSIQTN